MYYIFESKNSQNYIKFGNYVLYLKFKLSNYRIFYGIWTNFYFLFLSRDGVLFSGYFASKIRYFLYLTLEVRYRKYLSHVAMLYNHE
jgi:hypothetical protein